MSVISCIIVTFKSEDTIAECLTSLVDTVSDILHEIIVIDNDSGDRTVDAVSGMAESHPRIKLIVNRSNLGFARAVNQGLAAGSGDYFLILNPDTVLHDNSLQTMLTFLRENNEYGIVAPKHVTPDGSTLKSCREFPTHLSLFWYMTGVAALFPRSRIFNGWKMGWFDHAESRDVDQPMGACLLTSRQDFEEIGYLDEQFSMFFNDVDWCRRYSDHGKKIRFLHEAVITHHGGHSIRKRKIRMILSSHLAFFRYFRKYYQSFNWIIPNTIIACLLLITAVVRVFTHALNR